MKKRNSPDTDLAILRLKAEELLKGKAIKTTPDLPEVDALKLIHELEVYQAELEMQNKALELASQQAEKLAADKYNELFDFAPLGFFTLERSGEIIEINLSGAKLLEKERSKLKNNLFDRFVSNNTKPIFNHFLTELFDKKSLESCEVELLTNGNSPVHVHLTGILTESGKLCLVTAADISERKLADQALLEKNTRLELALRSADMAWWEVELATGKVTFGKRKAEMLGYPPEMFTHYNDFVSLVHPDDRETAMNAMRRHLDGTSDKYEVEYRILTKSGQYAWFFDTGSVMERDMKGNPLKVTGLVVNITESKNAIEALQDSETKFRMVADFAYDWEYWLGRDGQIIYMSPSCERISGYTTLEFQADKQLLSKIIHPEDHKLMDEHLIRTCSEEYSHDTEDFDFRIVKKDGSVAHIAHLCRPVFDSKGNFLGRRISNRDISARKRADEALNNERLLLRTLIDNIPDSIYSKDLACRKTLANLTEVRYMGARSEAEVLGKNDFDIYPKELAENFFADDRSVLQSGKPVLNREEFILDENGQKRWLLSSKLPLRDKNGKIIGLAGIGRDITGIKQAQVALQESEELYRNLVEKLPDGIYKSTHEGRFVDVNPALVEMLGYSSKEDLLAIDIKTQLYFEPSDRESVELKEKLEKIGVYRMRKKDGSEIWVEDHGWLNFDEKQNIVFHEGIMRDVTESKRAEWALQESETLYRNLVVRLPDGVYKSTHEGKFIEVNPALVAMLGYDSKEDLLGIDIKTQLYFEPTDRESLVLQEKLEEMGVYRLKKKDGTAIWVEDHGWYVPDANGNILFHEGIMRDITERKKAEDELRLKNEELQVLNIQKDKFFSIIAHDLRGPFSGFLDLTELMAEGITGMTPDEIQKIARVMKNSAANIYHLIGNLLEWSLMQRGITTFDPVSFLLLPKVQESIVLPMEAATKKAIVVSYDIPDELKTFADANMFGGILRNLATNAVKFTPKGGRIHISAKKTAGNLIQISVNDTGIGMNKIMIEDLFRLDINTSRKGTEGETSTGLGLIICKDFVEKQGGTLWVDSVEGKGSTFHFTMPADVIDTITTPVQPDATTEKEIFAAEKLKILIAENDETSEMLISITVKPLSKEVLTVKTGIDAVEACRNNPDIDLVLMDIQMPEMDGYEATRLIRRFNEKVIIIAQTAYGQSDDRQKAIEAGCNEFLSKPLDLNLLKQLIQKHF